MYTAFFIGSLLMPTCKTEFNGLETTSYLFPKDETSSMAYTHTRTHIYEIKHIFYNVDLYLCRIHVLLYICTITEEYRYNVLINVIQIPSLESAHTQIIYNHIIDCV